MSDWRTLILQLIQRGGVLVTVLLISNPAQADVVKPSLIEISAYKTGAIELEVRASVEALLTGINAQYKTTQESPMADAYDELRALDAQTLKGKFSLFKSEYLSAIRLLALTPSGERLATLTVQRLDIPAPGYTQVPRISTLLLSGTLPQNATAIRLNYPSRFSDYAVRVRQVDLDAEKWHWSSWEWIKSDRASQAFSLTEIYAQKTKFQTMGEFIPLGFLHILPRGLDHILFILGLFLFSQRLKPLLWQITMFTLAHTLTLGLATAGYIELSPRIVEPLIALSIAYVGFENIFAKSLHKHRLVLVFAFGLLHGLGFAAVLTEFDLPRDAFITALLSFNLGVEFGQLAILLSAWLVLSWAMNSAHYRRWVIIPGSLLIGITGLVWTIERLALN